MRAARCIDAARIDQAGDAAEQIGSAARLRNLLDGLWRRGHGNGNVGGIGDCDWLCRCDHGCGRSGGLDLGCLGKERALCGGFGFARCRRRRFGRLVIRRLRDRGLTSAFRPIDLFAGRGKCGARIEHGIAAATAETDGQQQNDQVTWSQHELPAPRFARQNRNDQPVSSHWTGWLDFKETAFQESGPATSGRRRALIP